MIEPYFAVWKKTRDAWSKDKPLHGFRQSWKNTEIREKFALAVFMIWCALLLPFTVFVLFNQTLFPVYCVCYVVFLLLYAIANRVLIERDRRIPERKLEVRKELIENLRLEFESIGLANRDQMRIVKEEAVRLLDRKEHRHEMIVHTAIEICILAALVAALNFVTTLLEYGLPLETAGLFVLTAVTLAILAVFVVRAVWTMYDRFGALPTPKLRLFVSDRRPAGR